MIHNMYSKWLKSTKKYLIIHLISKVVWEYAIEISQDLNVVKSVVTQPIKIIRRLDPFDSQIERCK